VVDVMPIWDISLTTGHHPLIRDIVSTRLLLILRKNKSNLKMWEFEDVKMSINK
jgi:hypothetical protein